MNLYGRAMRFAALESAGFALQLSESRLLNFELNFFPQRFFCKILQNFRNFRKTEKRNRNSKIYFRRLVEQSLLIAMPKTALLYRQNLPRSLIFEKHEKNNKKQQQQNYMRQIEKLARINMF